MLSIPMSVYTDWYSEMLLLVVYLIIAFRDSCFFKVVGMGSFFEENVSLAVVGKMCFALGLPVVQCFVLQCGRESDL